MKIALVVPGGVDRSGTHKVIPVLLGLIERLARDHEVHVFALHQEPHPAHWTLLGACVSNAGHRPRRLRAVAQMLQAHRKRPFDVVHAFWAGGPGAAAAIFGWITGVPVAITLPGGDLAAIPEIAYGAMLNWRGRWATQLALRRAARVFSPSVWMQTQARTAGVDSIVLGYGVARDRWPCLAPRRRRPGAPLRLVHLASLNRVKDQPCLIAALVLLARHGVAFTLDIAGQDCLDGAIEALVDRAGLGSCVRFHGFVTQDLAQALVGDADMLVMSSRHEGVPIALLEAAMAGVPTVGTAVGQIADWANIADCGDGAAVAVPIGDSAALAQAIAALASDEERRLRIAQAAQDKAMEWDADRFATALVAQYRALQTTR